MPTTLETGTPLDWPAERSRTVLRRRAPPVGKAGLAATLARARAALVDALDRLGAREAVLTTDIDFSLDLAPSEPADPGAVARFRFDTRPHRVACDGWDRVAENIFEIARRIDEAARLDRTQAIRLLAEYALLPPSARSWRLVLGFEETGAPPTLAAVEQAFRLRARRVHPDAGGTVAHMAELNAARDAARAELSGA